MVRRVRTVAAAEFKAKCLALLDEVGEQDTEIIVTKRGKVVARLVSAGGESRPLNRPSLAHYVRFSGDVESPIDAEWDAMQ